MSDESDDEHFVESLLQRTRELSAERDELAGSTPASQESVLARNLRLRRLAAIDPERPPCVGRIDYLDGTRLYIGRTLIESADGDALVISWDARAAKPFFLAHVNNPMGLRERRRFTYDGVRLVNIAVENFDVEGRYRDGQPLLDQILAELDQRNGTRMPDIVATINREQYAAIMDTERDALLVTGGPGTGKTAVALHRLAHLMFQTERLTSQRPVILGPNPGFLDFVAEVLPGLGHTVERRAVSHLGLDASARLDDPPEVARLKGDPRMSDVMRRFLYQSVRVQCGPLVLNLQSAKISLSDDQTSDLVDQARAVLPAYGMARRRFIGLLADAYIEAYRDAVSRGRSLVGWDEAGARKEITGDKEFRRLVERAFPGYTSQGLVRDLLTRQGRLAAAADGVLREDEVLLLLRKRSPRLRLERWTVSDSALIDEADELLGRFSQRYTHVVLDEAQDLTPMQLRAVGRRCASDWLTVAGDLAQASGDWQHYNWKEVFEYLGHEQFRTSSLSLTYRVPDLIMQVAGRVLQAAAPSMSLPIAIRPAVDRPLFVEVAYKDLIGSVVANAADLCDSVSTTAIIAPEAYVTPIVNALHRASMRFSRFLDEGVGPVDSITVVRSVDCKGLEFSNVIVVEPEGIILERPLGQRVLYVALTRALKRLRVIHADPLPPSLVLAAEDLEKCAIEKSPATGDAEMPGFVDDQCYAYIVHAMEAMGSDDLKLLMLLVRRLEGKA